MNWSPLQREMLEAMGLPPLQFVSAAATADAPSRDEPVSGARGAGTRGHDAQPRDRVTTPAPDRLTAALLRAAGWDRDEHTREAVLALCPLPQALRGDARAKRALWPHLRALRGR
jgi:hypothetical protein